MPQQVNNPWLGYINRSYSSIKTTLLSKLGQLAPEVSDHSESNILVIILSMFAGMGETFHYYLDNLAREAFITTARRYSSAVSLVKLVDYRIKPKVASNADIYVYLKNSSEEPVNLAADFTIPQNTEFKTNNGISFITLEEITLQAGNSVYILPVKQVTKKLNYSLGNVISVANQILLLPDDYAHGSAILKIGTGINEVIWEEQTTFGYSNPFDKHYIVDVDVTQKGYIAFGDGTNGLIPPTTQPAYLDYHATKGADGNVDPNTINIWVQPPTIPGVDIITVTNPIKASGGADVEDLNRVKRNAPLSIRTLDRAVTDQDYIDVSMLAPGVDKAGVFYDCGKYIDIYITPNGGGIAPLALLASTKEYVDERKIITTKIRVSPAGETNIKLTLNAWAMPYIDPLVAQGTILQTLYDAYGYLLTDVNKEIYLSDIYALVDNLPQIDYLNITGLTTIPYARPRYSLNQLNWERETLNNSNSIINWRIVWDNIYFRIFRDGVYLLNLPPDVWYQDVQGTFKLKCSAGSYDYGDEWDFRVYPANQDLLIDDFTVPLMVSPNLTVNVF